MKRIYLVRHGQSLHNAARKHQQPQVKLSKKGLKQSQALGQRFKNIPLEVIISSPQLRARETAECISKAINKKIVFSSLLEELRWPSELEGVDHDSPTTDIIFKLLDQNILDQDWHFSDEENIFDLKKRALKCLKFLQSKTEENILVVSHGNFLKMLVCVMLFGEKVTPDYYLRVRSFLKVNNTGIIAGEFGVNTWKIVTWNDYTHLI